MKHLLILITCVVLVFSNIKATKAQTTLQTVDFETAGGYTTSVTEYLTSNAAYYTRLNYATNSSSISTPAPYTNYQGSWIFVMEDTGGPTETQTMTLSSVNISGYTSLQVKVLVAGQNNTAGTLEINKHMSFYANIDGGGDVLIGSFRGNGSSSYLYKDDNLSGSIEGGETTVLTAAFTEYTFNISGTGSNIVISTKCLLSTVNEEGAYDNIRVLGTLAPTNNAPTDISLSATSVSENVAGNTTVGTLSTTDADAGDTHTYSLVAGAGDTDNGSFNISGSNLRITNSPNYETKSSYSVRVQTSDGTATYSEAFTITINDVAEPPTVTTQAVSSILATTATGNGNITVLGEPTPTQYGVVWDENANPDVALSTKTTQGVPGGTGAFTSSITGLSPNTTYHVRAYATNTAGTSYGNDITFTTTPEQVAPTGDGSAGDPYRIATLENLYWVTQNPASWAVGKNFIQTADIDLSSVSNWPVIGNNPSFFYGTYDGDSHTISGLKISKSSTDYIGLFGFINSGAIIKNLGVINATVQGRNSTGAIVGYNTGGTILNCYCSGSVTGADYTGGLAGTFSVGIISNCYSLVNVTGTNYVGGLIGYFANLSVTNCYSKGSVNGSSILGGLIGSKPNGTITNSFWDTETSGRATSAGGATGKTTAEMNLLSTFYTAGWDFYGESVNGTSEIWNIGNGRNDGYPYFRWQYPSDPEASPGSFTGTVNNDWATAGNWAGGSVPTSATDISIPAGKTAEIAPGTSASCNNITVDAAGSLTIQSSSATNAGSLIVAGTATGNVTFESYLAETGKWHVVAAPVAAQNIWDFATLAGNSIAANAGKRAVTEYVEGTNTWDTSYPTSDTEGSFSAGSGYTVLRSAAGLVAYTGTLNTSDVSKPLTRSLYGWNALGNPYTSAINATVSAHATNNLITANTDKFDPSFAALYVWDAATNTYVTINNTGTGSLVQNYIQAGQGFFVRAKDNTGLNFSITEAMQTHQTSTPLKSGETAWPTIQLAASGNGKSSKTVVTFNRNMTTGLDITYDAGMFKADKNFALYSRLVDDNGIDFAIQALPENYNKLVIPLGIDVPAGTEITFSAETMNLPADAAVYLEDRAAKTITQLDIADANYIVTVTEATKGTGNFFLHTSAVTTVVNELENNLKVYTRDRAIYISGILNSDDVIAVYGVDGKLHYRKNSEKTGLLRIDAAKMPAGVYLISIQQNAGRVTRKVVISE
jgi:hypothetical protein